MIRPILAAGLLGVSFAIAFSVCSLAAAAPDQETARFELPGEDVLIDDTIPIVVSGLTPGATAVVRLRGGQDEQ